MKADRWYYALPSLYELPFLVPPHSVWRRRAAEAILTEVIGNENHTGTLLEIGSGSGFLSRMLAKRMRAMRIYAIDVSRGMVEYAASRNDLPNLRFFNIDFFDLAEGELCRDGFEVIISLNSWCFFSLEESVGLVRLLSKRGTDFVAVTYAGSLWSRVHSRLLSSVLRRPLYLHRPSEFVKALERKGFRSTYRWVDRIEGSYLVKGRLLE